MTDIETLILESNRLILLGIYELSDPGPIRASLMRKAEDIEMLLQVYYGIRERE